MVTYCKNRSRIRHLERSCSWRSVIAPVINIVEAQRFRTTLAIVVKFTCLQRAYNLKWEVRESSELTRYEGERMWQYFSLRASQVILAVVKTFLDLTIESQEFILSLGAVGSV